MRLMSALGEQRTMRTVAASLNVSFLAEALYPLDATIGVGFTRFGRTSWTVVEAAFQEGRCLSVCEAVVVHMTDGKPSRPPEAWRRAALAHLMPTLKT